MFFVFQNARFNWILQVLAGVIWVGRVFSVVMKKRSVMLILISCISVGPTHSEDVPSFHGPHVTPIEAELARNPQNVETKLNQCSALIDARRYDDALAELQLLLKKQSKLKDAYVLQSQAFDGLNKYQEALNSVNKALALGTPTIEEIRVRAKYLGLTGNYLAAISIYDKVIVLSPRDPKAYACRGACFFKLYGSCDRAISDLEKCLELDPSNAKARKLLDGMKKSSNSLEKKS